MHEPVTVSLICPDTVLCPPIRLSTLPIQRLDYIMTWIHDSPELRFHIPAPYTSSPLTGYSLHTREDFQVLTIPIDP